MGVQTLGRRSPSTEPKGASSSRSPGSSGGAGGRRGPLDVPRPEARPGGPGGPLPTCPAPKPTVRGRRLSSGSPARPLAITWQSRAPHTPGRGAWGQPTCLGVGG